MVQGYCVKCRSKKEMKNAKAITMKNKKPATQGTCPSCGALHARGAMFCWQCGNELKPASKGAKAS